MVPPTSQIPIDCSRIDLQFLLLSMKEDLTFKAVDSGDTNRPILEPILLLKLSFLLV